MDEIMLSNQQKELEQNKMLQQTEQKQLQQGDMQQEMLMQQDMLLNSYAETKLSPTQQRIYENFLSKQQKQQLVNASQVADGMPVQDYKPKKQSVKKKVSNWWNRSKRSKQARERYDDKNVNYLTDIAIQAETELAEQTNWQMNEMRILNQKNGNPDLDDMNRSSFFFFQGYKKNEDGAPLNDEERKKKYYAIKSYYNILT